MHLIKYGPGKLRLDRNFLFKKEKMRKDRKVVSTKVNGKGNKNDKERKKKEKEKKTEIK